MLHLLYLLLGLAAFAALAWLTIALDRSETD
jgi:hypothetical protein